MMVRGDVLTTALSAIVFFAATNIDDIVLLSVLFADPRLRPRSVVLGQFIGIGTLVLLSAVAGVAAVAIPRGWTSLLGAVPLVLGLYKGAVALRARAAPVAGATEEPRNDSPGGATVLAVAGITLANGGDNLSVYIPVFAADRSVIVVYVLVFAVMTGLWCFAGFELVDNRIIGRRIRRYGDVVLPVVLIALGAHILYGARILFRAG